MNPPIIIISKVNMIYTHYVIYNNLHHIFMPEPLIILIVYAQVFL